MTRIGKNFSRRWSWQQQVLAYSTVLGLYLDKRLEVVSDGASWISDWVKSLQDVAVEQVLCWYRLRNRTTIFLTAQEQHTQVRRFWTSIPWIHQGTCVLFLPFFSFIRDIEKRIHLR